MSSDSTHFPATSAVSAWDKAANKLHILLVISSPIDEPTPLNPKHELQEIYRQLSKTNVPAALIRLKPPTWRQLASALSARRFDIVHFVGHAREDAIQLEKEDSTSDWVSSNDLADLFRNAGVKLVVLNNCSSESIGDALVSANVPAVIATSRRIHSDVATLLSSSLYSSLAGHHSVKDTVALVGHTIKRSARNIEEALVTALGPGANQPILDDALGIGDPEFFACDPLNNLPSLTRAVLFDRIHELLNIYKLLVQAHSPFIGILGIPGTGKSMVALAAAWRYGWLFPRGIAYASLRSMRPFNLTSLFAHFMWGLDEIAGSKQRDVALYELARGPVLILLDDLEAASAEDCKEIVDLLSSWDTTLGGRAILIMRNRRSEFDGLVHNWVPVDKLPESAALELVVNQLGGIENAETTLGASLPKVPNFCRCHPKLITLTTATLQLGVPWSELATQVEQLRGGKGSAVEQMVQVLAIAISQVEKEAPVAGQFLDCWPVFAEAATEEGWRYVLSGSRIAGEDPIWLEQSHALMIMQRANILQRSLYNNVQYCQIHPLVSEYLQKHRWKGLTPEKCTKYERRHLEFYLTSIESKGASYSIIPEWNNVLIALQKAFNAKNWSGVLSLCTVLVGNEQALLLSKNLWSYAKQVLDLAIQASQELSELKWQATFLHNLGISQYRSAEYQEAQLSFERSLTIAKQIGETDLMIDTIREIGRVCYRLVRYELAKEYFDSIQTQSQLKGDHKRVASALHELGRLAYRQKDRAEAERLLNDALIIRESIDDKLGIAQTLHELARVLHVTGKLKEAESMYQRSLALRKQIGDLVGQQGTIHQMGLLAFDQGDYEVAQKYYDECVELSNELNDRFWIAHNLFRYGRLLWRLDRHEEAISLATQSLRLCNLLGISLETEVEGWLSSPA